MSARTCGSNSCRHKRRNHSFLSPPASIPSSSSHLTRSGFLRLSRLSDICLRLSATRCVRRTRRTRRGDSGSGKEEARLVR